MELNSYDPSRSHVLGVSIDTFTMKQAVGRCTEAVEQGRYLSVGVVNAAKIMAMRRDAQLSKAVSGCQMILADGQSVVWASRMLRVPLPERVAGIDLFQALLSEAERRGDRVYFLGARPDVLEKMLDEVSRRFPELCIAGARDGYFTAQEEPEVAADIRNSAADMLFVGMSSPKKELFLNQWGEATGARVVHGVGGSFDVLAGITRRAPLWYQKHGLEWFYRARQEPLRLGRRYLTTNTSFITLLAREVVRSRARSLEIVWNCGSTHGTGRRPVTTVVVVGMGYVGLPLAIRAAQVGHQVVGFDIDSRRVDLLASGESYIEDVPGEQLRKVLEAGRFRPSSDSRACAGFDVAVIATPTPLRDGLPDLSYVESAASTLAEHLRPGATVIVESTSYPGTTQERVLPLLEEKAGLSAGLDFHLGYSPERIDPGNSTWTLITTPKIISGIDDSSLKAVRAFYDTIVEQTVAVSSPREAELAKLIENTFRQVNIALVNELAMFAHDLDIDLWESIRAASTKPFGFMPFTPGPGVGGHCLPIDPSYLSWRVERALGKSFRFVELADDINRHMPDYVVHRLLMALNSRGLPVRGARILLLGLAYKKNTGDARESPAVRVAQLLVSIGADVRAADPHVVEATAVDGVVARVDPIPEELAEADVVVLLTDHDAFDFADIVKHARYSFDCRHRLVGQNVETL